MEDHVNDDNDDKKSDKTINNVCSRVIDDDDDDDSLIKKNVNNDDVVVVHHVEVEVVEKEESELNALSPLLPPPRKGGIARKSDKMRRSVQWNDKNGNKLFEVKEFQPSDVSDSDDENNESCMCNIL